VLSPRTEIACDYPTPLCAWSQAPKFVPLAEGRLGAWFSSSSRAFSKVGGNSAFIQRLHPAWLDSRPKEARVRSLGPEPRGGGPHQPHQAHAIAAGTLIGLVLAGGAHYKL
jgi:hypothetical protein